MATMSLDDVDLALKVEYMLKGLDSVIQKSLVDRLRPLHAYELKAWFVDMQMCSFSCFCKCVYAKIRTPNREDEPVYADYSERFKKCSVRFENNDYEFGTVYLTIDSSTYAYPSIYDLHLYVDDNDENIVEIRKFLKENFAI